MEREAREHRERYRLKSPPRTRLRILIYGLNYAPELTGIGKYTGEMAEWLAARGHQIRVVTAPPYYPAWRIRDDYRGALYRTERAPTPGRPTVFRTPLYVPPRPTGLKRTLHLLSFMLGSIPVMLRQIFWKPDIVWTVEPTFFCAPLALLVASATGAASWLHIQDFEVDAAFDLGILQPRGPVRHLALALELAFTRGFTRVSSISASMVRRLITKGLPAEMTVLFPNWVDTDAVEPSSAGSRNGLRDELGLEGKTILLYSGNMGNKQGLEVLAPLAKAFETDPAVHFVFCGDGAFQPQLHALVAGQPNVTLLPLQPMEQLNDLLNAADIHLLPQKAGAASLVMPSKLSGIVSSGRPVLVTAEADTELAMTVEGRLHPDTNAMGIVVPTSDADALHGAARRLVGDPELRASLGTAARHYAVAHLGRDRVLSRFEDALLDLVRKTGRRRSSKLDRAEDASLGSAGGLV